MAVKRPSSLKILGQKYDAKYDYNDDDNLGLTVEETSTIFVRGNLPENKVIRVLMHEVTHAILNETPFSIRKRFDVEEVCDIVGFFLINVLKDNPHLVKYILTDVDEDTDSQTK